MIFKNILLGTFVGMLLAPQLFAARVSDPAYENEIEKMEIQWRVLHIAYANERKGDLSLAILYFQKALLVRDQNVPRNALLRLYEKTGQYDKALEQVEWFLKGDQNEQGRQASLAVKQRLLEKIEAQKLGVNRTVSVIKK